MFQIKLVKLAGVSSGVAQDACVLKRPESQASPFLNPVQFNQYLLIMQTCRIDTDTNGKNAKQQHTELIYY